MQKITGQKIKISFFYNKVKIIRNTNTHTNTNYVNISLTIYIFWV